jgi:hypothetical protein
MIVCDYAPDELFLAIQPDETSRKEAIEWIRKDRKNHSKNMQTENAVKNLFAGTNYFLQDGTLVKYKGFVPKDGHHVESTDDEKVEIILPHDTKFYATF